MIEESRAHHEQSGRELSRTSGRMGESIMDMYSNQKSDVSVDPIEEMQLRTWARTHYQPPQQRDSRWHPIILDEMSRKDRGT